MAEQASWKDRFVDARFSAAEATEWERLVDEEDVDRDAATAEMIRRRSLRGEVTLEPS